MTTLAYFAGATLFEIAGCFAFWSYFRLGRPAWTLALGVGSLVLFAYLLTRVDTAFAGRAYAAYGGIYVAASLVWLKVVEGVRLQAWRSRWGMDVPIVDMESTRPRLPSSQPWVRGTGRLLGWAAVGCAACCALPLLGVIGTSTLAAVVTPASGAAVPIVAFGALGIGLFVRRRRRPHAPEGARSGAVCTLPPADRDQRTRDFRALFDGTLIDRQRDASGARWMLSARAQTEAESRRFAALEERCCDGIRIAVTREGDVCTWQITGPASAAATLDAFYDLPMLVVDDRAAELWARLDGVGCGPRRTE